MDRKIINEDLSVSGQLSIDDISYLLANGVKSIICNRPDHEDPGQLEADVVKQAAENAGLNFHFMPVVSGQVTQTQGEAFGQILADTPKPIHAYCRSGTRCTILWAIQALLNGQDKESVLHQAAQAGYDLSKTFA